MLEPRHATLDTSVRRLSLRTITRALLASVLLLALAGSAVAQTSDEDAIIAVASAFEDAYAEADFEAIAASYVEDSVYIVSDGTVLEGPDAIANLFMAFHDAEFEALGLEPMKVRVSGDMAFSYGRWTLTHASGTTTSGYYSIAHERTDDGWLMAHTGNTPIEEEPEDE